ncbi:hypothetical protein T439DRAFT_175301 [Meredithblackwellia eburnea MCA 4105]
MFFSLPCAAVCFLCVESVRSKLISPLEKPRDSTICSDSKPFWSFGYTSTVSPSINAPTPRAVRFKFDSSHPVHITRQQLPSNASTSVEIVGYKVLARQKGSNGWWKKLDLGNDFGGAEIGFKAVQPAFRSAKYEAEIFFIET